MPNGSIRAKARAREARAAATWLAAALVLTTHAALAQSDLVGSYGRYPDDTAYVIPPVAGPTSPPEPPGPVFGLPGQWVITAGSAIGGSTASWSSSVASDASLTFSPGFDVFVARHVSLGLSLDAEYDDDKGYTANGSVSESKGTQLAAAARVGYVLRLGPSVAFWPRLFAGGAWSRGTEQTVTAAAGTTPVSATVQQSGPYGGLDANLVFQVAPRFFVGGGPYVSHAFYDTGGEPNRGQATTVGGGFVLGGWLGGEEREPGDDSNAAPSAPPPARRFGEAGEFVLDGAFVTDLHGLTSSGSGPTGISAAFEPGFDYFVVSHVSLGASVLGSYESSNGYDAATGQAASAKDSLLGISARLGGDLPLGSLVSIYARVGLGYGAEQYSATTGTATNQSNDQFGFVDVYVPLLLHPAPHVFVGFGPSLQSDLTRTFTFPNTTTTEQDRKTTLGAGLVVGGWL